MRETIWFTVGCLLINGVMDYFALDFLRRICPDTISTPVLPWPGTALWLVPGSFLTLLALYLRFPGMLPVHMLFLLIFAKYILKAPFKDAAAPIAILFTLYTFIEGLSAIIMSWLSANIELSFPGIYMQLLLSLVLAFLFFLALCLIQRTCSSALRRPLSSCLYLLLLPCALMVFLIRCGLQLDSSALEKYLSAFNRSATFMALLGMAAAVIFFFLTLHVFCKVIHLTEQEQTAVLLAGQLRGQQTYIEEARKRNEQYAALRHDLNNHLLVLSGLLDGEKYETAKSYAHSLRTNGLPLSVPVATGRAALDVLLNEKLSHARRNGIRISCGVQIPQNIPIDDMDLCVIFSNILDNAINACRNTESTEKNLSVTTKTHSRFFLIESTNSAPSRQDIKPGTGLNNIRRMAEKYQGTTEITNSGGCFRISILLCPADKPKITPQAANRQD
ncbi:MAG TPA: hypothetical protein DF613_16120 [Lachnospiraceae bacterium]|nr:hypothetical protein [Lachnospiraceae bacterium]